MRRPPPPKTLRRKNKLLFAGSTPRLASLRPGPAARLALLGVAPDSSGRRLIGLELCGFHGCGLRGRVE